MRVVVCGIGAIGGVIAARLALSGIDVVGIARGGMLEAVRSAGGLKIITASGVDFAPLRCVGDPSEIDWRGDEIVLLTMKSNDTWPALASLRNAGVYSQPIVCAQNGVANERMALRLFPNVFGMVVMMPAQYLTPGVVAAHGAPKLGLFDLGRFPSGADGSLAGLADALNLAGFVADVRTDVMAGKYGKLLLNTGNIVGAALGADARLGPWYEAARSEGVEVYRAAGIAFDDVDFDNPRRDQMKVAPIEGVERAGSSSVQSLLRGTGSIETDWLNGEIALLGRLHGVATPVNAALVRVAQVMVARGMAPGSFPEDELRRLVEEA
jgi:2-dehydropantoate 2-reductase